MATTNPSSTPAISVVIPLYNQASLLSRSLRSLANQTMDRFEAIVIDDGSTDGGAELVEATADPRIRLIRQRNAGASAARNRAISQARANLIAFLDADDEWMPNHLADLLRLSERFPQCALFGAGYIVQTGPDAYCPAIIQGLQHQPWEGIIHDYFALAASSDPPLTTSAVAVRRDAIMQIGGFPDGVNLGEDLLTWARLALRHPVSYCSTPSVKYWNPAINTALAKWTPEEPDRVGMELWKLLAAAPPARKESLGRYLGAWHKMRGILFLHMGQRHKARWELRRATQFGGADYRLFAYRAAARLPLALGMVMDGLIARAGRLRREYRGWLQIRRPQETRKAA